MSNSTSSHTARLLRADELAKHLACGKSTVYRMVEQGQIPAISIGRIGQRFDLNAVLSALQRAARQE